MTAALLAAVLMSQAAAPMPAAPMPPKPTERQKDLSVALDAMRTELVAVNQDIWEYAELGLQEFRSAARLIGVLEKAGFKTTVGVSGMPTAFIAEYGSGAPIIGILAEYDALPDIGQTAVPTRSAIVGKPGHGCGHSAFGTAVVGAAIAVKQIYEKHKLRGTIRVYGTPAEETIIGKVYLALDGKFKDLDACLHWHPGNHNRIGFATTKAAISVKFNFAGQAAHAAGAPFKGRSALDAVELMSVGVNYMREHVKTNSRIHYVITNGGGQPNVVPPEAQVWYYIRSDTHEEADFLFDWVRDIAEAAAKMSRTTMTMKVDTDCHEIIPNLPLSKAIERNFHVVGPPIFDDSDRAFAAKIQESFKDDPSFKETKPLHDKIDALPEKPYPAEGGSTDVGDVSWFVPVGGMGTACFALGSPGHSWQNVAAIGSPIGHKGMMTAAKVLAFTIADMLTDDALIADAKKDFAERMKGKKYTTHIPPGQPAPKTIR